MQPQFVVLCGPMFGSKTTRLIAAADRYRYQKKRVVAFKPKMDTRYEISAIKSHSGATIPAIPVNHGNDILEHLADDSTDYDVVIVDEAFMIDEVAEVLIWLFKNGLNIVVSSIELSATCNVFDEMRDILPWATRVEKCPAVCTVCSSDAYYTYKKQADGVEVAVGGSEMYEPRCWHHHPEMNKKAEV